MANNFSGWDIVEDMADKRSTMDNVHGLISLSPLLWSVIDTPQFQRLREIKQLGVSYRVFVSASHNRFEHCIGVAHLAGKLVRHLQHEQPNLGISERDVGCVELAGLCHDLGHGPWSHVWDDLFIPAVLPGIKWSHEEASEMMFDDLIASNNIGVPREDADFIKDLIRGEPNHSKEGMNKKFLFEIVANKRNGIDVDKFDYIRRDTKAIGTGHTFDTEAFIKSARVIDNEICYSIKQANNLFELCHTRFSLHKRIYNHKTARAIEHMIIDALKAAEPHMKIAERIRDPKKYVHLTDNIMQYIKMTDDESLQESRDLFMRIDMRDLYQCVDYKAFDWDLYDKLRNWFTEEKIVQMAKEVYDPKRDTDISPEVAESLNKSHVVVDMCKMHYGMKEKNPLDSISFYSKRKKDESFKATRGDSSTLMPSCFGECLIRVYTRDSRYLRLIQIGYNGILDRLASLDLTIPSTLNDDNLPLTPVDTIPTQPNSRNASFSSILDGAPRTPSASGSVHLDGGNSSSPGGGGMGEMTPFTRNRGMQVSRGFVPKTSPQKSSRYRALVGNDLTSELLTNNVKLSSESEKEQQDGVGSPTPLRPAMSVKASGELLPPFRGIEGSPSPAPPSSSQRRSPRVTQDATTTASTSAADPSRKLSSLRGGPKKKRADTEDADADPPDGSSSRKRSKR